MSSRSTLYWLSGKNLVLKAEVAALREKGESATMSHLVGLVTAVGAEPPGEGTPGAAAGGEAA